MKCSSVHSPIFKALHWVDGSVYYDPSSYVFVTDSCSVPFGSHPEPLPASILFLPRKESPGFPDVGPGTRQPTYISHTYN